jgi:UDP-2,3-diacylglucosamine hydrolase
MYYFASDTHLGLNSENDPRERERVFVAWLDAVSVTAEAIFLVGDIFDFWFEYKRVIPKGFVRLFGKLAELVDRGIPIHFFPGNHDMWTAGYFASELGMVVHTGPEVLELAGRRVFVGHGDAINVGRRPMLRLMNRFFRSRSARAVFSWIIHPDCFLKFGHWWSSGSRKSKEIKSEFRGEEEGLVQFARHYLAGGGKVDYFVFGHIHCAEEWDLGGGVKMFFLGEWFQHPHYVTLSPDGEMSLRAFNK